jgi:hypothetical protein
LIVERECERRAREGEGGRGEGFKPAMDFLESELSFSLKNPLLEESVNSEEKDGEEEWLPLEDMH